MSKHTPGPWVANSAGVSDASGLSIAMADDYGKSHDERVANARLIAAAPGLLALLIETLQPGAYGVGSTLATRIEAAIAKATGADQ